MSVSTHVLDAATGHPAAGVPVVLACRMGPTWTEVAARSTDDDGRVPDLATEAPAGVYRLQFDVADYSDFFPEVSITFRISDAAAHHHVPLLLSPFAYSTYRGS